MRQAARRTTTDHLHHNDFLLKAFLDHLSLIKVGPVHAVQRGGKSDSKPCEVVEAHSAASRDAESISNACQITTWINQQPEQCYFDYRESS